MHLDKFFHKRIKHLYENKQYERFFNDYVDAVNAIGGYDAPVTNEKFEVLSYLPMKWNIMALSGQSPFMLKDMTNFLTENFNTIDLLYAMTDVMEEYSLTHMLDDLIGVGDCNNRGVLAQKIRVANNNNEYLTKSLFTSNFESIESVPDYEKDISIRLLRSEGELLFLNKHLVEAEFHFLPNDSIQFCAKLCSPAHTAILKLPFPENDHEFINGELRVYNQYGDLQIYPINGHEVEEYLYSSPYGGAYLTNNIKILVDNARAFKVVDSTHAADRIQLVT